MMSTDHPEFAAAPPRTRSRITNDPLALPGLDGRSAEARRFRDLVREFASELGRNGADALSATDKSLVRQAAGAIVAAETLTARLIAGDDVNADDLSRAQNNAQRALTAVRRRHTARRAKPAGESDHRAQLAAIAAEPAEAAP